MAKKRPKKHKQRGMTQRRRNDRKKRESNIMPKFKRFS